MSARRPNYTAVGDDGAPDLELTSRNPFNDQSAQEDKNIGHSSTRNPLVDDADADEVDLKKGADATAAKAEECEMMDLRCLDLQGRTFKVRVPADSTVGSLKATLEAASGNAAGRQRLIYGGRQLGDDAQSLADAKVKRGTVVHLFVRPECAPPPASPGPGAEGAALLAGGGSETAAVGGSHTAQLAAVAMLPLDPTGGGANANGAAALEMGFSGDPELQDYRARVKLLASLLLIVSVLNSLTLTVYLLDALFAQLAPRQWLGLGAEVAVNALGVAVGVAGLRGTASLDQEQVAKYCRGLLLVGFLYVATDVLGLARALAADQNDGGSAAAAAAAAAGASGGESSSGDDAAGSSSDSRGSSGDAVSTAVTSLLFTVGIWGVCFYRAFQFQRRLGLADLDAEELT